MDQITFSYDHVTIILPESHDSQPSISTSHKIHKPSISVREKRKCKTRQYYNARIAIPAKEEFLSINIGVVNGKRIDKTPAYDFFDWYLEVKQTMSESDLTISAISKLKQEQYSQELLDVIKALVTTDVYTRWEEHWFDCDSGVETDVVHADDRYDLQNQSMKLINCNDLDLGEPEPHFSDNESCVVVDDSDQLVHMHHDSIDCTELQDVERIEHIPECSVDTRVHPDDTLMTKYFYSCLNVFKEKPNLNYYSVGLLPRNCKGTAVGQANVRIFRNGGLVKELHTQCIEIVKSTRVDLFSTVMCDTMAWQGRVPCNGTIIVVNPFKYSRWKWKRWSL